MARGRSGGRPTVESCLTLSMQSLRRNGALSGGKHLGWFSWTYPAIGTMISERLIGRLSYEVVTAGHEGLLRITSIVRADPMGKLIETSGHVVRLEATVPPFGGLRWWFVCPISGQLVSKIHLPRGAHRFGSQKAHRLGYASQRETDADRARRKARRLRRKIGGGVNLAERLPGRPKWMRHKTYWRHMAVCIKAEEVTTAALAVVVARYRAKRKVPDGLRR